MLGKLVGAVLIGIAVVIFAGVFLARIPTDITYKNAVRGYMDRAYWSMSPDEMIDNFRMAKQGMVELGLEPEMNGGYIFKTMDVRMDAQYKKMDALIQRAEGIRGYCNGTIVVAQISGQDLCETKLNALKTFVHDSNGWADDIAESVYYVNYHPFLGFWGMITGGIVSAFGFLLAALA